MRILHVVEATVAGVRRHVQTLACGLNDRHFEVAVACPERRDAAFGDDQFVPSLRGAGVTVLPVPMVRAVRPLDDGRALADLLRLIRNGRYQVVHCHSSKAGLLGRLAARLSGKAATVYTPNGLYFQGLADARQRSFYLRLEQLAGRLTDQIVAVSPGERDLIVAHRIARPDRVELITNGIEPPTLPPDYNREAQRRSLGIAPGALLIGTVARLAAQKNPALFLDAAAQLLCNIPTARFVWIGSGELLGAARQRAAELGIAHACRFLGHREDATALLAAFDVFWLTSQYEGLPYALLEALALSIPVVATDVVGSHDMLAAMPEPAGVLVPPGDAVALAAATFELASNPAWRIQLAQAGYQRYMATGRAEPMLQATAQLYTRLGAQRPRQARRTQGQHI